MSPPGPPARYLLSFHPDVAQDLADLDPEALGAAAAILDDLAYARVTGKALAQRNVSGDLTGLYRVRFDTPGHSPTRFRVVYKDLSPNARDVLAIGVRDGHAIYKMVVARLSLP
ncbi:MAG: hypothetical protein ACRDOH_09490 [Streptosporangiaceae bacterium]